ncbi:MAG TPA: DegT/DnrJ/EryC1/StrS family aminotransferase, partial [Solirubrobacterales bacterium]|nr:DegT/DnrJ/EryC1/StrS family aminotransferase [Solirubrobacterales bacterium]
DSELADRLRLLRNYGTRDRYEIESAGTNSRLAEVQAAVLRVKLKRLDDWNRARAVHAEAYRADLAGRSELSLPSPAPGTEPVWHLFVLAHPDRDDCCRRLAEEGIQTLVHYPVLPHRSPAYPQGAWPEGSFPVAERLAETSLSLPLYPQLPVADREAVAEAVLGTIGLDASR